MKNQIRLLAFSFISLLMTTASKAQVGIGTSSPDASAMLQVESTTKGVLVSSMTQLQRQAIPTPAAGLIVYQNDGTSGFYYNAGTSGSPSWVILLNGNSALPAANITGTIATAQIANGAITPTKISSTGALTGQVLSYNGSSVAWTTPGSGGGTFSGPTTNNTTANITSTVSDIGSFSLSSNGIITLTFQVSETALNTVRGYYITDNSNNVFVQAYNGGSPVVSSGGATSITAVLPAGNYKIRAYSALALTHTSYTIRKFEF